MSVEIKVLNKLDNQNVQVEIKSEKSDKRLYYKVPQKNLDTFINEYKKNDKKTSIIANTAFVSSIFASVIIASLATKKLASNVLKWIIGSAAGIAGATLSILGTSNYIDSNNKKLLQKHNALELNYKA